MVRSRRRKDVIDLGNRIVEELELQEGVDTLAKWMSHYLAELILRATRERSAAKRKKLEASCFALIERLWKNRGSLPRGARPLGRIEEQLDAIETMMADMVTTPLAYRHRAKGTTDPWLTFAIASHAIDRRMAAIALLTSFLNTDVGREKRWVVENSTRITKKERELIESLDRWLHNRHSLFTTSNAKSVSELEPPERIDTILEELKKALQAQQTAYNALKESLRPSRTDADSTPGERPV